MPAGQWYFLTPQQVQLIQEIADIVRDRFPNTRMRGGRDPRTANPSHNWYTRDTFVALPPTGGIPALTPGLGSPGPNDQPGSAVCDIYYEQGGKFVDLGITQRVYNFSTTALPQQWMLVTKDKNGTWYAITGGGGSTIYFGVTVNHIFQFQSGFVTRYSGSTSASLASTGTVDTVYSRFGDVVRGAWLAYVQESWGFEALQTACPTGTGS